MGAVIVPTTGAIGVVGCAGITILVDEGDVHPSELVTVYVYVPWLSPEIVVLVPVPDEVIPPGLRVNVHVPVGGNPFRIALPVDTKHVGAVMVPTTGAVGVIGCALMTTFEEATEVHPSELVTVYVKVPEGTFVAVMPVPVPVVVTPPGLRVKVHDPNNGKPLKATLPVASAQVGCIIVPTTGAVGVTGCVLITTLPEELDVQPSELVTVNEYDPVTRFVTVVLVPVPEVVTPPGFLVNVQVPDDGNPLNATLPVAKIHVGWVMVPITGADGVTGCILIITFDDEDEVQPSELVTVYVYVPDDKPD